MKSTRTYTMTSRAAAVEATRASVLDALVTLSGERPLADIGLGAVAERADVSVQTVLRHFGSRAGLLEAAVAHARVAVEEERRTPVGDVGAAVRVIVDHYELRGRGVLLLLAQEQTEELVKELTDHGRALHRAWVEETFAPHLPHGREARTAAVDLLVVACDVYTWKLLRLDRGLSRETTLRRMEHLVGALLNQLGTNPKE